MPKFILIAQHMDEYDEVESTVTHEFNYEYLPDVLMGMDSFLRGVGFVYDGELGVNEPVRYTTTDLGNEALKDECCGGCNSFEDTVQHNDHFYDINRNR